MPAHGHGAEIGVLGLLGLPIGGMIAWTMMGAASLRSPLPFLVGSYGEGLILALCTGIIVALATLWYGRTSWVVPVAAAIVINVVALLASHLISEPMSFAGVARVTGVFLPPSLVAAMLCWLLSNRLSGLLETPRSGH